MTVVNLRKAVEESDRKPQTKPIMVVPRFAMKWLAGELGVAYSTVIETVAIKYVESRMLVVN